MNAMTCDYCERQAWPTLDNMCERHYNSLVVFSLAHAADRATREWFEAIDKVCKVERVLGLRAAPISTPFTAREILMSGPRPRVDYPRSKRVDDSEDFI